MGQLILVAGVSRSGKSSFSKELCALLHDSIHLDQDEFVKAQSEIPTIKDRIDWETPDSIDWNRWRNTIDSSLNENRYVVAEGIFAFTDLQIIKNASLTIAIDIPYETYLQRRMKETRWGNEPEWFLEHVWHSHLKYHNPHKITPDIMLSGTETIDAQQVLLAAQLI
ncbi:MULTISPECIES: hypothetical protein [Roseivirga]|uniref:Phosphoribulokinase/uridine kinase domain-containing protein n=1 Tax=Roseivirga thermotolerans TaxID=1758176 RepID=A0ABQ3I3E5_9BACT|nr:MULTISPECIES: hypothetical protein [Roseivirga]GHE60643.1 hypothetical protein GCM10011340_14430 [Roseivirga thermotolerans]|tara:strand:- start:10712 stop:11212 length:501 start_codon:yes stop_codon:yes gene_type:complete